MAPPSPARRFEKRGSLDKLLGGGLRRRDLILLGGDIGSGKSALALGIALRVAQQSVGVAYLSGEMNEERLMERALAIEGKVVVDYLQLVPPPKARTTQDEDTALVLRHLKALALAREVALLVVAQLPRFHAERDDQRPTLDDYGVFGAPKQHADVILSVFREEMYRPGGGVEGATELIVAKNRNGPTGFVDLYFYRRWMRFEDMLDPDR